MKHHEMFGALAISTALALALAGCTAETQINRDTGREIVETHAADYNPQSRENLQVGGEAHFAIDEIPEQLNQFHSDGTADSQRVASWYFPQILLVSAEGEVSKNDAYLDEWKTGVVDGNTTVTFRFRDDAHWNDGTDMDWKSIENTWVANRSLDEGYSPHDTDGYRQITSVEAGDTEKTAVVTYDGEFAWPEMAFLTGGLLHPSINTPELYNEAFINALHPEWGAGPYTVAEFDPNVGFVAFTPNPEWWGDEPLLDEVTFQAMDSAASLEAYQNGDIDMVAANTKDRLAQLEEAEHSTVYRSQQTAKTILMVNADSRQFADVNARKAFFLGVDIDQQKEIAWDGLGYEEESAGSLGMYAFQDGYVDAFAEAGLDHDPEAAKQLLDDAGWAEGEDGIREKDGTRFTVVYPVFSDEPAQQAIAESLQAQERDIGIEVQIETRPSTQFSADLDSKAWDVVRVRFTDSDPFGPARLCQLYCSESTLNLSATGTTAIDKKITNGIESQTSPEEWTAAAMRAEPEIVAETWGIIPLYNGPSIFVARAGLANLTPEPYVGLDGFGIQPVEDMGWEK